MRRLAPCLALALAAACRPAPYEVPGGLSGSGGGGSSGGGSTGGGGTSGGSTCSEGSRSCAHTFSYAGAASSAAVHGNFTQPPWTVAVPMAQQGGSGPFTATVSLPWGAAVQYKFQIDGASQWIPDPGNPDQVPDGLGGKNSEISEVTCAEWSCAGGSGGSTSGGGSGGTTSGGSTGGGGPSAFDWRDAIMYFAFTDRFVDGDPGNDGQPTPGVDPSEDWHGGDWAGITQKIQDGYFDSLSVNVLWISPPVTAAAGAWPSDDGHPLTGYHGYWPSDFTQPEPHFGTLADLQALVAAAHGHGIRVVLDDAMHHVIQTSPLYAANPSWFWPLQNQGVAQCVCGAASGCSWDGTPGTECWFTPYLPAFDYAQGAPRDYTVGNAIWWVRQTGADGLRLDAVKQIDPSWIQELRSQVDAQVEPPGGSHFYLVGETFSGDKTVLQEDVNPTMLDGQFDFPLRAQIVQNVLARQGSMQDLDGFLSADLGYYGPQAIMGNFLGNHDVPRAIEFADDTPAWTDPWALGKERAWTNQPELPSDGAPFQRLGAAFAIVYTLPGIPLLYYGDEIGMNGAGDPDNRHPMYWTGYSQGQQALLAEVQKLGQIRAARPALRRGQRTSLWSGPDVIVYGMSDGSDAVYVAVNRGDSAQQAQGLPAATLTDQLGGGQVTGPSVQLPPRSAVILAQ